MQLGGTGHLIRSQAGCVQDNAKKQPPTGRSRIRVMDGQDGQQEHTMQSILHHNLEDRSISLHHCENLKFPFYLRTEQRLVVACKNLPSSGRHEAIRRQLPRSSQA
jgi:hypothetical protein